MKPPNLHRDFLRYVAQTSGNPLGLEVAKAKGCYIWDTAGIKYLDFTAGISVANVGHCHPAVIKAIREQSAKYLHTMVYGEHIQEPQVRLGKELAEMVEKACRETGTAVLKPRPTIAGTARRAPTVTYFCNSGAEAVEGAFKLARKYTGRMKILAFEGAYHGDTMGALSACGDALYKKPFDPLVPLIHTIPWNNLEALEMIDTETAGVIIEPIQGEAGIRIPSARFMQALRRRCSDTGALLIFDEAQTGFGRTGKWFAFEHFKVVPDVLVLAKALGGGMPLGAFLSSSQIMRCLSRDPPFSHVTTFGGHPVACAAGFAALRVARARRLPARAAALGERLLQRLRDSLPPQRVREVRGMGLFIGIEFHSTGVAAQTVAACYSDRLLVGTTLFNPRVIRLSPPLSLAGPALENGIQTLVSSCFAVSARNDIL